MSLLALKETEVIGFHWPIARRYRDSGTLKQPCQHSMEIRHASTANEKANLLEGNAAKSCAKSWPPRHRGAPMAATCSLTWAVAMRAFLGMHALKAL